MSDPRVEAPNEVWLAIATDGTPVQFWVDKPSLPDVDLQRYVHEREVKALRDAVGPPGVRLLMKQRDELEAENERLRAAINAALIGFPHAKECYSGPCECWQEDLRTALAEEKS